MRRLVPRYSSLPRIGPLNAYLVAVAAAGTVLLVALAVTGGSRFVAEAPLQFWVLALFAVCGELLTIKIPRHDDEVTSSTAFVFAILLAFGLPAAVLAQAIASFAGDARHRKSPLRSLFNAGQQTISVVVSGAVLIALTELPAHGLSQLFTLADAPGIAAAAATYFVVNNVLAGVAPALALREPVLHYLRRDLVFQALTAAIFFSLAPIVVLVADFNVMTVSLLALPLLGLYRGGRDAVLMEYRAHHDSLTDLPNRVLFKDRLEQSIAARRSTGRPVSVLMMDVNHFKEINDTLGHHHGDLVLQAIGPRLRTLLRDSDTVARLGGDEFAVLLPNADLDRALAIARKLANALHLPFEVGDLTLQVGASIGIATSPDHGSDVETLVQRADVAMFLAKETGSEVEAYSAERDHYSPDRLILAGQLRKALQDGQIVPFYQPSVDLKTGRVSRVEALARWIHPERGVLGAPAFIPLAEQLGLIRPLTLELIGTALMEVRSWMREGLDITVAVNLSTRHLIDTQLPDDIAALLRKHEVAPSRLTLEITESTIMADTERSQAVLRNLRAMGVGLAIDDFGTGYSSLAYLKRLAVDALKIDKSFVTDMTTDPSNAVIVRSTIELGHNLGLQVVAEGVETEEVRERLVALDCDVAQGYALSKPLPADQLTCWIREYELRHGDREPEPALTDDGSTVVLFDPGRRNNHETAVNRSSTR